MPSTTPYIPATPLSPEEEQRKKEDEALSLMGKEIRNYEIFQYLVAGLTILGSWGLRRARYQWLAVAPLIVVGLGTVGTLFVKQTRLLSLRERILLMRSIQEQQG